MITECVDDGSATRSVRRTPVIRGEPNARTVPGLGASPRVDVLSGLAWHNRRASGQYGPQVPAGSRSDRACAGYRLGRVWRCAAGGGPWVMSCLSRSAANAAL